MITIKYNTINLIDNTRKYRRLIAAGIDTKS